MLDLIVIGVINIHSALTTSLKGGITNPISEYSEKFSGSALHIALNASILKAQVGLIAPVGRDAVGLMDLLKRYSVDYSHIVLSSKKNPNFMELHTSHRHYDLYYEGAVSDLHVEKIEKEYLKKAKAVHLCFPDQKLTGPFPEGCLFPVFEIIAGVFFQDNVKIGASKTEGACPGPSSAICGVMDPGTCLRIKVERRIR